MNDALSAISFGFLLGLSFFLGLAFEDFYADAPGKHPGGIRTFPMLALAGGILYLLDPVHLAPLTAGLLVLGAWLTVFYSKHIRERNQQGEPNVGLVVLGLNVLAFLLGAVALALPHWVAVGTTVAAVLLLTSRERLHKLARRVKMKEIITAGQFLILTGLVLPLLPAEPVTTLTSITPRQAWFALLVVCTLSYVSYLAQHYWPPAAGGLWMAALGGLYSSTATTVVLARQAADDALRRQAKAGITLATGIMYLRILAIVAVFNLALAGLLIIPLLGLSLIAMLICAWQYWAPKPSSEPVRKPVSQNPLELGPAAIFAGLFVLTSLLSAWVKTKFGLVGIYSLAALVGITDIDPFVLNLAQGGISGISNDEIAAAILIAASFNNLLKAGYAAWFAGGRATKDSAAALIILAVAGLAAAVAKGGIFAGSR